MSKLVAKKKRPRDSSISSSRDDGNGGSMVVFSSSLCQALSLKERLAPVYVGVRQIRPSYKKDVVSARALDARAFNAPVYKVFTADGQERRMTAQEKKQAKLQQKLNIKQQKESQLKVSAEDRVLLNESEAKWPSRSSPDESDPVNGMPVVDPSSEEITKDRRRYVQLTVDPIRMEEELADVRGDRDGVPPVMLSPPLARIAAMRMGITGRTIAEEEEKVTADGSKAPPPPTREPSRRGDVILDDALAEKWATLLKDSMWVAEVSRQQEDLRPMPYHIVPEVWTRLRPMLGHSSVDDGPISVPTTEEALRETHHRDWSWSPMHPPRMMDPSASDDAAAIIHILHNHTHLHISCGAKFGCDYLLYDGPRHERHAFAGLRILPRNYDPTRVPYPFPPHPNAYDLAGYVRCLNTAGKLALLATVVDNSEANDSPSTTNHLPECRVLIIDLALEKIAVTTSRRPKKTLEQRLKNLAKTKS